MQPIGVPGTPHTEVHVDRESPQLVFVYRLPAIELQRYRIEIDALPIARRDAYRIGFRVSTEQKEQAADRCYLQPSHDPSASSPRSVVCHETPNH